MLNRKEVHKSENVDRLTVEEHGKEREGWAQTDDWVPLNRLCGVFETPAQIVGTRGTCAERVMDPYKAAYNVNWRCLSTKDYGMSLSYVSRIAQSVRSC